MARPVRLLFLSENPARNNHAGALLLHRHFSLLGPRYELHHAHHEPAHPGESNYTQLPYRPVFNRLLRTRFRRVVQGLEFSRAFLYPRAALRALVRRVRPDLILTVAEGSLYISARELASRRKIPLVSFFHDWSPAWLSDLDGWPLAAAENSVRHLYRDSACAFCISEELLALLGPKTNSHVLFPIPEPAPPLSPGGTSPPQGDFYAIYSGTFRRLYAAEMKILCRELARRSETGLLRIIGPDPEWRDQDARLLETHGFYRGFAKGPALRSFLEQAPAHLVISPFNSEFESVARYSFPSKIPEYCRFGRPIVVWGPPYSAAVRWARRSGAARVVDDPSPAALVDSLRGLAVDVPLQRELAGKALHAAATEFNPLHLQRIFEEGLEHALAPASVAGR